MDKNNEMPVILKKCQNGLYARGHQQQAQSGQTVPFKSGKYVGCYAPLGCRKRAADRHILEINSVPASTVRRSFGLQPQGYGFCKHAPA